MNSKAIELAISTLILITLGIILLIALVYALTGGFESFNSSTEAFTDTSQATSVKLGCNQACQNQDKINFCCKNYTIDEEEMKCTDSRLEIDCSLDCAGFNCSPTQ